MKVSDYCRKTVVTVANTAEVWEAAKTMRENHIGFLVVHEEGDADRKPVGVLTDRDIVVQVVAREVDPHSLSVDDVMTRRPLIAHEHDDLSELLKGMRLSGVRRLPVVDKQGALRGVIALDDVVAVLASLLGDISASIHNGQVEEWRKRTA